LPDTVPPRALSGTVEGASVPKRKCVGHVGGVIFVAPCIASPCDVPFAGACAPLPLCAGFACHVLCSPPPVAALYVSVSISSSRALWRGLLTSSNCPNWRAWVHVGFVDEDAPASLFVRVMLSSCCGGGVHAESAECCVSEAYDRVGLLMYRCDSSRRCLE